MGTLKLGSPLSSHLSMKPSHEINYITLQLGPKFNAESKVTITTEFSVIAASSMKKNTFDEALSGHHLCLQARL